MNIIETISRTISQQVNQSSAEAHEASATVQDVVAEAERLKVAQPIKDRLDDLHNQEYEKLRDLGQAILNIYQIGEPIPPALATLVAEIETLQAQIGITSDELRKVGSVLTSDWMPEEDE